MGRVFRSQSLHSQRQQLLKLLAFTLRALLLHQQRDAEARDMAAFLALTLDNIQHLVNTTCAAWERKGFWLKADKFRREWAWAGQYRDRLYQALEQEDWEALATLAAQLFGRVSTVPLPKRPSWGTRPWQDAWKQLQQRAQHGGLAYG